MDYREQFMKSVLYNGDHLSKTMQSFRTQVEKFNSNKKHKEIKAPEVEAAEKVKYVQN